MKKFNIVSNDHGCTQKRDFFILEQKYFLGNVGRKDQNNQFELIFGMRTNPNMQNSMVIFTFFVLDRKYPFWVTLVPEWKIVCLK